MVCKDCVKRSAGCHSSCPIYLKEKKEHDEWASNMRKARNRYYEFVGYKRQKKE